MIWSGRHSPIKLWMVSQWPCVSGVQPCVKKIVICNSSGFKGCLDVGLWFVIHPGVATLESSGADSYLLNQWFSTGVPRNPRVPWPPSRGSMRFFRNLNKLSEKILKFEITSNDIIAGNGRVLKLYLFSVWLYLFKQYML